VVSLEESSLVVFCYLSASEIWLGKRMVSLEESNLVVFTISLHLKSSLIRGVVSLEESSLVVFCYLIASEIWPDKRGGLCRGE